MREGGGQNLNFQRTSYMVSPSLCRLLRRFSRSPHFGGFSRRFSGVWRQITLLPVRVAVQGRTGKGDDEKSPLSVAYKFSLLLSRLFVPSLLPSFFLYERQLSASREPFRMFSSSERQAKSFAVAKLAGGEQLTLPSRSPNLIRSRSLARDNSGSARARFFSPPAAPPIKSKPLSVRKPFTRLLKGDCCCCMLSVSSISPLSIYLSICQCDSERLAGKLAPISHPTLPLLRFAIRSSF